jgi:exopolyphosphatase/guanosine-5'-triphosphate,3'-diphosphate pyrophosphatase
MRLAPRGAIDVGSNTVRLLVARPADHSVRPLLETGRFVRLGQGVDETGMLQPERAEIAMRTIGTLIDKADAAGAEQVHAFATSAVRDAANGPHFVEWIHEHTGIDIEILSEYREGELTYLGATLGLTLPGVTIVADLGGRSTEIVAADPSGVGWVCSLPIGSGRLTEGFITHDPPRRAELRDIAEHVSDTVRTLPRTRARTLVLTGGTARQIGRILHAGELPVRIDRSQLDRTLTILREQGVRKIVQRYSIRPERAEVLPAGIQALQAIARYYRPDAIVVTRQGIREGVIVDSLRREGRWSAA